MKRLFLITVFITLLSSALKAETTVQEVLNHWADAIGGIQKLQSIKTFYSKASISVGGLNGITEDWNTASGNHKSKTVLGSELQNLTVFDAAQNKAWYKDENGKVHELESTEFEEEITSAYMSSYSMFFPERMKGKVEFVGEDDTKQNLVLNIMPKGGREVKVFLDKRTYLPIRAEQRQRDHTLRLSFSDYREVNGIKQPFEIRQSTGDSKYDLQASLRQFKIDLPLNASTFAKPAEAPPDYHFANATQAMGIPFQLTSNHIYVQLSINNSPPLLFLLDSGAEFAVINELRAKELGFKLQGKLQGRGSGEKSTDVSLISDVSYRLKGVEILHQHAATINLDALEMYEGRRMDGILGYDFISRFVVEIDYESGLINLYDPKRFHYTGSGYRIPIQLEGNTPFIEASIEVPGAGSFEGPFAVDTGSRLALILNKPFHESHQLAALIGKTIEAPMGFGVGGQTKQKVGRIAKLQLGGAELKDVLTSFSLDEKGSEANPDLIGNIGGETLRRFKVIVDYSHKTMILEPNSHLSEPFLYDMSGITVACNGSDLHSFKVLNVLPDSPAAEAGIQVGEILQKIDEHPVSDYTLDQIRMMFKKEGLTYEVTTNRGTFKIKTRRLI